MLYMPTHVIILFFARGLPKLGNKIIAILF